ncbi:MAG: AAA family ATPase [Betaproteobacteria bacterium]|nr:AAA family ATPase [Betaproteobacteria bacterium]
MDAARALATRIRADLSRKLVILTGPRQAGKTTLARMFMADYARAQYLNWDVPGDRELILAGGWSPRAGLVVFDEIHKMRGWKAFLKGVWDGRGAGAGHPGDPQRTHGDLSPGRRIPGRPVLRLAAAPLFGAGTGLRAGHQSGGGAGPARRARRLPRTLSRAKRRRGRALAPAVRHRPHSRGRAGVLPRARDPHPATVR